MSRSGIAQPFSAGIKDANPSGDLLLSSAAPDTLDRSNASNEVPLTKKPRRIPALDFTKGTLVLIMVLYHWLRYFVTANGTVFKYLRFLTPSFIFITGFLISHVYLSKYETAGLKVPRRLLTRGVKLLGIVFFLNMAPTFMHLKALETRASNLSSADIVSAYLTGTSSVAFSILVPIAYLLILSAGLLIVSRLYKNIFHAACTVFVACALIFELKGIQSGYLQIFSMGMLGISVGYIPMDRINGIVKRRLAIFLAYLIYLSAITLWNDAYPLQIVGVCLSLAIIYWMGIQDAEKSRLGKIAIRLGQYSLFAYIAQILILQILLKSLGPLGAGIGVSGAAFFVCLACMILSVEVLDRARPRMTGLNKVYTAVFG